MATNHYTLTITSNGADAVYKLSYKNGKFFRLEAKRQKLNESQRNKLMMLIADKETNISNVLRHYNGVEIKHEQKQTSSFTKYLGVYSGYYYNNTKLQHRMNGIEGNALKQIIKHLESISATPDEAFAVWQQILSNWDKLEPFYAKQMELRQINSNINIILRQLKDGRNSKSKAANNADELRRSI